MALIGKKKGARSNEQQFIKKYREQGYSASKISDALNIDEKVVKSFFDKFEQEEKVKGVPAPKSAKELIADIEVSEDKDWLIKMSEDERTTVSSAAVSRLDEINDSGGI